jgi:hypothetical protein
MEVLRHVVLTSQKRHIPACLASPIVIFNRSHHQWDVCNTHNTHITKFDKHRNAPSQPLAPNPFVPDNVPPSLGVSLTAKA